MSLTKKVYLTISGYDIKLSDNLMFYQNDQLKLIFYINEYGIDYENNATTRALMPVNPLNAILFIENPEGVDSVSSAKIEDNAVTFYLDSTHTQYVGVSRMQLRLFDQDGCAITLPHFTFEIRENIYGSGDVRFQNVVMVDHTGTVILTEDNDMLDVGDILTMGTEVAYPQVAKTIKDLPIKHGLDGTEKLIVEDNEATKQAPLTTIVDEIKQNSQEKIREIESELAQTNAQLSHIKKLIYPSMEQNEIQKTLSEGGNVRFTSGNYDIVLDSNGTGLRLVSNSNISFDDGVVIRMVASDKDGYQLFSLYNVENVTISGYATMVGDKDIHIGNTGEWGHCFKIEGCKNIALERMTIKKFWGDGIYIGESSDSQNENIVINGVINEENRRQGISVITCDGLTINDCICRGIKGINPQAGIDIEPNNSGNIIKNISINNLRTYNCVGSGLCISIARIGEGSDVSITVNNHYDYKSTNSLLVFNNATKQMQGLITINDSYYDMQGINNCINIVATSSLAPKLLINRPRIHMSSEVNNTTASPSKNAIAIWQPYESNEKMGNVDIVEPYLFGNGRVEGFIYVRNDLHKENVEKVHIIKPRKDVLAGASSVNLQIPVYANDIFVDLDNNNFNLTIDYDCTLHNHMQRKYILSKVATANRTVGLQLAPYGYECELQNDSPTWSLIGSVADSFKITVPPKGYAKIRHIGEGNWEILHKNFDLPISYDGPPIMVLTQSEYSSLDSIDNNTLYFIKE